MDISELANKHENQNKSNLRREPHSQLSITLGEGGKEREREVQIELIAKVGRRYETICPITD